MARRSAARCVATPCRRKRSGAASHTDERSKKSKVRARVASAWTASGERSSTALTTDSTRPRVLPSTWLARRRTAMTSATSDSTAATTSPVRDALLRDERAARGCATRRARGTPRAPRRRRSGDGRGPRCGGAGRRRRVRWARRLGGWGGEVRRHGDRGRRACHSVMTVDGARDASIRPLRQVLDGRELSPASAPTAAGALRQAPRRSAAQRLVAAEHGERLEDAGRHRRAGQRDAHRLEDVLAA